MAIIFNYKNHCDEKPTYVNIFKTLQNLRTFCLEQQIKRVATKLIITHPPGIWIRLLIYERGVK